MSSPIIVVTGANGGVGFGICQRLLFQLSQKTPPDAFPQLSLYPALPPSTEITGSDGLTLIMACRSRSRAEAAKIKLLESFDEHVEKLKSSSRYDGHAEVFRQNLNVVIHTVDLSSVESVLTFGEELSSRYPYISHLIFNAGVAAFIGMDWFGMIGQIFRESIFAAFTTPSYYKERVGDTTADGLGWVWQSNLLGHFIMFRSLEPMLARSPRSLGARVLWTSSMEAHPRFYEFDDWQLLKTTHSYGGSKYQIDLIASNLDRIALSKKPSNESQVIRHVVTQPGVASTNISNTLIYSFLDVFKVMCMYIVRWCGSPHHPVSIIKAAVAVVHLSLLPITLLPSSIPNIERPENEHSKLLDDFDESTSVPVRFGACTTRSGKSYVGVTPVRSWKEHEEHGLDLLKKCDGLYRQYAAKRSGCEHI